MKRVLTYFIILILLTIVSQASDNLYQQDSLQLQVNVNGEINLVSESSSSTVKEVTAEVLLYPTEDYRQSILDWESSGEIENNKVNFAWNNPEFGIKNYGYSALLKTNNKRIEVNRKVLFPLSETSVKDYRRYLQATTTIDSNNPQIIAKASELTEGEDDLFKVTFNLAEWVEKNVNYELDSLTASASQKASWVLQNKRGVCDEMTSLFVAMCRSLGIPARFVSGVSYTTSDLFSEQWQPHGWAEVYFPEIGWVGFDITFGEYGYIDVTHIKLRDGFDPQEPSTKFEWLADNVNLESKQLSFDIIVKEQGRIVGEEINLEQELLAEEVGIGSYNLVRGILKNTADYYAATTLQLAVPEEVEIIGRNKRTILLKPKEVKETYWIIKVADNLDQRYSYQFPTLIYSERNRTVQGSFSTQKDKKVYSKSEVEKLLMKDEEKSYSRKIVFDCDYPPQVQLDEEFTVKCSIKNKGNSNLENVEFCLGKVCETIDLPINQEYQSEIKVVADEVGWNNIFISGENNLIEKKTTLEYVVSDPPKLNLEINYPPSISYNEKLRLNFKVKKNSFSTPKEINIHLAGPGFENVWQIDSITEEEELAFEVAELLLTKENDFTITTTWRDEYNKTFSDKQEIMIIGEANNFSQKGKMFFNRILLLFS